MKIRSAILFVVVALLLALVVWLVKRPVATPMASEQSVEALKRESGGTPPMAGDTSAPPNATSAASGAAASIPMTNKAEQARNALTTLNDVSIDFYGKVQDQFGVPVSGAVIAGSVIYDNGISNGVRQVQATSDPNGLFELHGGNGASLSIIPRKEGYAPASTNAGFRYSHFYPETRHVAEPSHPTVIEMWKLQGAERLIHFQTKAYAQVDGVPIRFDLQTGQRVESNGDLIIRVESSPTPNATSKYGWRATIQAVNGGLMQCSGVEFEKMYYAPESGYEPEFNISYQQEANPWSNSFNDGFYLTSRDGKSYGKLGLSINTGIVKNGGILVMLNSYINPGGSRNLELDPALVSEARP